jgi:hypothetical protein
MFIKTKLCVWNEYHTVAEITWNEYHTVAEVTPGRGLDVPVL